jgi:opacity protein-like surface antigen
MGGVHVMNKNETALPDQVLTIPAAASVAYHFNRILAAEGECTWLIPVKQVLDLPSGGSVDRKAPDVLAYQANMRASLPLPGWTPYVTGGVGAMTILGSTGADRLVQVTDPRTAFAVNCGAGASFPIGPHWVIRGDFREFAAFPPQDALGFSTSGAADAMWMERGMLGVSFRF